jgi:hypothetical protein
MIGAITGAAAAAAAAAIALGGNVLGPAPRTGPATSFGGSAPVRIASVGRIDVDLEPTGAAGLHRVDCAGAGGSTACFVAR